MDRYLVTATVLGCSDKVSKQMQIHVNSYEGMEEMHDLEAAEVGWSCF